MNRLLVIALLTVLSSCLISCSSPPKKQQGVPSEVKSTPSESEQPMSAAQILNGLEVSDDPETFIASLLNILQLQSKINCDNTLDLSDILLAAELNEQQRSAIGIIQANCLLQLQQQEKALDVLQSLTADQENRMQLDALLYQANLHNKNWLSAAEALYRLDVPESEKSPQLWSLLSNLSNKQLTQASAQISNLSPYLSLLEIQRNYSGSNDFSRQIEQWRQNNQQHELATNLPSSVNAALSTAPLNPMRIGVILPLSGRYQEQGKATKEGILMAAMSGGLSPDHSIKFVDSNAVLQQDNLKLAELDIVIGPLLKENLVRIRSILPAEIPVLNLNRLEQEFTAQTETYYFSLAPEDEAKQIAEQLSSSGKQSPLVIGSASSSYQRMVKTFAETWDVLGNNNSEVLYFDNSTDLRSEIARKLDLSTSKARIAVVTSMTNTEVHAVERNRRDIDSIVIFASAAQTILINPIIESSISPFAEIIPVFASSRSFSQNLNRNSLRDLRNLQFIEMPWMLPSQEYRYLQNKSNALWPKRNDNHNRLFALGYDAINVIPHLKHLALLPNQEFKGMTGTLVLNDKLQTERFLEWAKIAEENVQLAMD